MKPRPHLKTISVRNQKTFGTGLMFVCIGLGALVQVFGLDIGTPTEMGPGFFPLILSVVLLIIGVTAMLQGARSGQVIRLESWPSASMAVIMAGVLVFAALIGSCGLIPAVTGLVVVSCAARVLRRPVEVLVICAILIAMSVGLFIYGIQLPIPLW